MSVRVLLRRWHDDYGSVATLKGVARNGGFWKGVQMRRMATSSPESLMLRDGQMSVTDLTTSACAPSHGSDHLSLVSSFGADIEGQKQFLIFQGHRWVSTPGPCPKE